MDLNTILDRFILLSGLDRSAALSWASILEDAGRYVRTLCAKEEPTDDENTRLDSLAGVYAYYRYLVYTFDNTRTVRAGDLSVTYDSGALNRAEQLWKSELAQNGDLVDGSYFTFRSVRG